MHRRNLLKGVAVLGFASLMPRLTIAISRNDHSIHFIGLGTAGCKALTLFKEKGINGQYTFITNTKYNTYLPEAINVLNFKAPSGHIYSIRDCKEKDKNAEFELDNNPIPDEIKRVFKIKNHYVLVAGLGRYAGTHLPYKLFSYLAKENISCDFYCCTPFRFEGRKPAGFAYKIIAELGEKSNFYYSNNDSLRYKYTGLKIKEAYEKADE